ncbi:hypothetical protein GCM10027517_23820 [Phycicoccus ginsengisoli]
MAARAWSTPPPELEDEDEEELELLEDDEPVSSELEPHALRASPAVARPATRAAAGRRREVMLVRSFLGVCRVAGTVCPPRLWG